MERLSAFNRFAVIFNTYFCILEDVLKTWNNWFVFLYNFTVNFQLKWDQTWEFILRHYVTKWSFNAFNPSLERPDLIFRLYQKKTSLKIHSLKRVGSREILFVLLTIYILPANQWSKLGLFMFTCNTFLLKKRESP